MLDSLKEQLNEQDCISIVYDGYDHIPTFNLDNFKCKIYQFYEPVALGHAGHAVRTKYASLIQHRDFVMHADDDRYLPNVFEKLREQCLRNDTLYIGKMLCINRALPETNEIKLSLIGTPCGIVPYDINIKNYTNLLINVHFLKIFSILS